MTHPLVQWNLSNLTDGKYNYQLCEGDEIVMYVNFDSHSETVQLSRGESRRTFKISRQGFLKSKLIINNEYGVKVGEWVLDKTDHKFASIELYEQKFICSVVDENIPQFSIKSIADANSIEFELPQTDKAYSGIDTHQLTRISPKQFSFMIALCWHLQKSVAPQRKLQVA